MKIKTYLDNVVDDEHITYISVKQKHIKIYPLLQKFHNEDKKKIIDFPEYIKHEYILDALKSPNGQAKTFGGLYVQNMLGGNIFRISINNVEYFESTTIETEEHIINIDFINNTIEFENTNKNQLNPQLYRKYEIVQKECHDLLKKYNVVSNFTFVNPFAARYAKIGYYSLSLMVTHYHIDTLEILKLFKLCGKKDHNLFRVVNKSLIVYLLNGRQISSKNRTSLHKSTHRLFVKINGKEAGENF